MKIFAIAAVTADGFIARDDKHAATWTSKEDKTFFREVTKRAGVMVMGSKTYETIGRPLPDRRNIVMSRSKTYEGVEMTKESPAELVARLEKEGVTELAVVGGAHVYTSFIKAGLVDTLYLTVEPHLFGAGVGFLNESVDVKLSFVSAKPLGSRSVVLEYAVVK
ncbi:MAG TPA: dihydrofolate reductase family protein [Candidatus Paceibacterota bacterium]|nr:dihydrofolate reductase family protein [Candidatus Paceibacterota bacterium]